MRFPAARKRTVGVGLALAFVALCAAGFPRWALTQDRSLGFAFENLGQKAGLTAVTVFGGRETNKYLLETTGCGAAFFDYDGDGRLDVFLVNGTTLEGFPKGQEPRGHLYRNQGDRTFEDVTAKAGLVQTGWGQGACVGDYDNDGHPDLFVSHFGQNRLYRNKGDGTFEDVTAKAGLTDPRTRWGTGCAFLDYDRDGRLDIFVANYIDLDLATTATPDTGLCRYKGLPVACGPPGLRGGKNALYRNKGDGTFEDVSEKAGITKTTGTYALGVSTFDFDDDGWVDLYVANDSSPAVLYRNNRDGTFTDIAVTAGCAYSQDGKPQAGMGVAIGDYDRNGTMDIFKTNFAGDTSTLYANSGDGFCEDRTFASGIGTNTRWLGWGAGFVDLDNDGWLDVFLVNGHVYPEVSQLKTEAGYQQRKVVYRNLGNGRLEDVTERLGPPATEPRAGRGAAFGDFDDDGSVDVVVNNVHAAPDLYRTVPLNSNHWLTVGLVGTRSNRSAIGARVRCLTGATRQTQEVRGGGSYASQNDLRVHFGLGAALRVDRLEVRWPNGLQEEWRDLAIGRVLTLTEGTGAAIGKSPAGEKP
jgi:enediyne biosynthesis protein E4